MRISFSCVTQKITAFKTVYGVLFVITIFLLLNCENKKKDPNLAGVKHFYFEFSDSIKSELTIQMIQNIAKSMSEFDYLMSEETANKGWPFYGPVKRGGRVLKTDMMPPHTNVNRLSPISELDKYNQGEHTMRALFTIYAKNDSTITVSQETFEWTDDQWHKFSKKLYADFENNCTSQDELSQKVCKTLIRYTFK